MPTKCIDLFYSFTSPEVDSSLLILCRLQIIQLFITDHTAALQARNPEHFSNYSSRSGFLRDSTVYIRLISWSKSILDLV